MSWIRGFTLLVLSGFIASGNVLAVQIVTESANPACEELNLTKELRVYKDPTIFLANLGLIFAHPAQGWEALMEESPLLTTVKGPVQLMRLGAPREFHNFGGIERLYERVEPRLRQENRKKEEKGGRTASAPALNGPTMIVPVKICGGRSHDHYRDSLGFVLVSDLRDAQTTDYEEGSLPPSTYPNPIPVLKD